MSRASSRMWSGCPRWGQAGDTRWGGCPTTTFRPKIALTVVRPRWHAAPQIAAALERDDRELAQAADEDHRGVHGQRPGSDSRLPSRRPDSTSATGSWANRSITADRRAARRAGRGRGARARSSAIEGGLGGTLSRCRRRARGRPADPAARSGCAAAAISPIVPSFTPRTARGSRRRDPRTADRRSAGEVRAIRTTSATVVSR